PRGHCRSSTAGAKPAPRYAGRFRIQQRNDESPRVDLDNPDVTLNVEVFGPWSSVGIVRRSWRDASVSATGK
ncbi:MAG: THUMP domain-containing protein, partial [Acidimicrobiia bacterium]|nr:THUMP domain-containing protein [Acidimicrobiia bacterium]